MASDHDAQVVSLQVCVGHRKPMSFVDQVNVIDGLGIEGDRHASNRAGLVKRQVLLMDQETLEELDLDIGDVRENISTAGIDLASLNQGQRLALGDHVIVEITGPCAPCERMNEVRVGLRRELEGRRGMLASVVVGGPLLVGDPIRSVEREP